MILLVGLIVLGPAKLPQAVQQIGRFINEIRRIGAGFAQELRDAVEEPIRQSEATLAAANPNNAISQPPIPNHQNSPTTLNPVAQSASSRVDTDTGNAYSDTSDKQHG